MIARRMVLAGLAALCGESVRAQSPPPRRIGFLSSRSPGESTAVVAAFRRGLAEAGLVEGRDYTVEFRWAEGRYDELPALAAELLRLNPSLLFTAGGAPPALAAKAATTTLPIVFSAAPDPVASGLVASLNRPGGNVTGMSSVSDQLAAKSIQLLKEALPGANVFAYLLNTSNPSSQALLRDITSADADLGLRMHALQASSEQELEQAFARLGSLGIEGLLVQADPYFDSLRERIVALAAQSRMPASYLWRENVAAGGLMSYGPSITDSYRRAGIYAGRILKGEKPADLPVAQPEKFELVVNLQAAKALGLAIPVAVLARADEVIE